jgi:hypothetical protein
VRDNAVQSRPGTWANGGGVESVDEGVMCDDGYLTTSSPRNLFHEVILIGLEYDDCWKAYLIWSRLLFQDQGYSAGSDPQPIYQKIQIHRVNR